MKRTAVCLATLFAFGTCRSWSAPELPNPQNDAKGICGRSNTKSSICDPDGYISQSDVENIDGLINFINKGDHGFETHPCPKGTSGPQIAVAVVDNMASPSDNKKKSAYQFAKDIHDQWGVGDAECQNGIVLFLAIKDRALGFSVGAGVRDVFTGQMVQAVISLMGDKMRQKEYGSAIINAVTTVGNILSGKKVPLNNDSFSFLGFLFVPIFIAFSCFSFIHRSRSRGRYTRLKNVLTKFDKDRKKANDRQFVVTSCAICLEDFPDAGLKIGESTKEEAERRSTDSNENEGVRTSRNGTITSPVRTTTAGFGPGTSDKRTEQASTASSDEARSLPCGHKFHESCILTWVSGPGRSNATCPICRQPIAESEGTTVERQVDSNSAGGWDVYENEYRFRVQRAHHYYPDFITANMMNDWERHRFDDQRPMASNTIFTGVDPAVVASAARSSGAQGASYSFGGGSSGGGGGGGGSW